MSAYLYIWNPDPLALAIIVFSSYNPTLPLAPARLSLSKRPAPARGCALASRQTRREGRGAQAGFGADPKPAGIISQSV